jgi:hypothetical protein
MPDQEKVVSIKIRLTDDRATNSRVLADVRGQVEQALKSPVRGGGTAGLVGLSSGQVTKVTNELGQQTQALRRAEAATLSQAQAQAKLAAVNQDYAGAQRLLKTALQGVDQQSTAALRTQTQLAQVQLKAGEAVRKAATESSNAAKASRSELERSERAALGYAQAMARLQQAQGNFTGAQNTLRGALAQVTQQTSTQLNTQRQLLAVESQLRNAASKADTELLARARSMARLQQISGDTAAAIKTLEDALSKVGNSKSLAGLRAQLQLTYLTTNYANSPLIGALQQIDGRFNSLLGVVRLFAPQFANVLGGVRAGASAIGALFSSSEQSFSNLNQQQRQTTSATQATTAALQQEADALREAARAAQQYADILSRDAAAGLAAPSASAPFRASSSAAGGGVVANAVAQGAAQATAIKAFDKNPALGLDQLSQEVRKATDEIGGTLNRLAAHAGSFGTEAGRIVAQINGVREQLSSSTAANAGFLTNFAAELKGLLPGAQAFDQVAEAEKKIQATARQAGQAATGAGPAQVEQTVERLRLALLARQQTLAIDADTIESVSRVAAEVLGREQVSLDKLNDFSKVLRVTRQSVLEKLKGARPDAALTPASESTAAKLRDNRPLAESALANLTLPKVRTPKALEESLAKLTSALRGVGDEAGKAETAIQKTTASQGTPGATASVNSLAQAFKKVTQAAGESEDAITKAQQAGLQLPAGFSANAFNELANAVKNQDAARRRQIEAERAAGDAEVRRISEQRFGKLEIPEAAKNQLANAVKNQDAARRRQIAEERAAADATLKQSNEKRFGKLEIPQNVKDFLRDEEGTFKTEAFLNALAGTVQRVKTFFGISSGEVTKAGDASSTALTKVSATASETGAAVAASGTAVAGLTAALAGIVVVLGAVYVAFKALSIGVDILQQIGQAGIAANSQLEQTRLGIASTVASVAELRNDQGIQLKGIDALNAALPLAQDQLEKIRLDALQTALTFEQIGPAFLQAVGPGLAGGLGLDQIRKTVIDVSQLIIPLTGNAAQLGEELRAILSGEVRNTSQVAKTLGITKELVEEAKKQGKLAEFLNEKLAVAAVTGKLMGQTFEAATSNLQEAGTILASTVTKGLFEQLRDKLNSVLPQIFNTAAGKVEIAPQFQGLADTLTAIFDRVGVALASTVDFGIQKLKDLSGWLATNRDEVLNLLDSVDALAGSLGRLGKSIVNALGITGAGIIRELNATLNDTSRVVATVTDLVELAGAIGSKAFLTIKGAVLELAQFLAGLVGITLPSVNSSLAGLYNDAAAANARLNAGLLNTRQIENDIFNSRLRNKPAVFGNPLAPKANPFALTNPLGAPPATAPAASATVRKDAFGRVLPEAKISIIPRFTGGGSGGGGGRGGGIRESAENIVNAIEEISRDLTNELARSGRERISEFEKTAEKLRDEVAKTLGKGGLKQAAGKDPLQFLNAQTGVQQLDAAIRSKLTPEIRTATQEALKLATALDNKKKAQETTEELKELSKTLAEAQKRGNEALVIPSPLTPAVKEAIEKLERGITFDTTALENNPVAQALIEIARKQGKLVIELETSQTALNVGGATIRAQENAGLLTGSQARDQQILLERQQRPAILAALKQELGIKLRASELDQIGISRLQEEIAQTKLLGTELTRQEDIRLRLAKQGELDVTRLNDGVEELLASQKGLTESLADFRTNQLKSVFDGIDAGVDKLTERFGKAGDAVRQLLKDLARLAVTKVFERLFGLNTNRAQAGASGGGGGGGFNFGSLLGGGNGGGGFNLGSFLGGGNGGTGGGFNPVSFLTGGNGAGVGSFFNGAGTSFGNAPTTFLSGTTGGQGAFGSGGLLNKLGSLSLFKGLFGGGSKAAAAAGTTFGNAPTTVLSGTTAGQGAFAAPSAAASLGALGVVAGGAIGGSFLGGKSKFGKILGGVGGGLLGGALGASGLLGGGIAGSFGALAPLLTNPFTAVIAGGLLATAFVLGRRAKRELRDYKRHIQSEYAIDVKEDPILEQVKAFGKEKFGKEYKKKQIETVRLAETKDLLIPYAERTGQKGNNKLYSAQLSDPDDPRNRVDIDAPVKKLLGGAVPGATLGRDHVPALLDGGEFVLNARRTSDLGIPQLNALNSGRATVLANDQAALLKRQIEAIRRAANGRGTFSRLFRQIADQMAATLPEPQEPAPFNVDNAQPVRRQQGGAVPVGAFFRTADGQAALPKPAPDQDAARREQADAQREREAQAATMERQADRMVMAELSQALQQFKSLPSGVVVKEALKQNPDLATEAVADSAGRTSPAYQRLQRNSARG